MMIYPIFSLIYIFFCSIYKISNQFILLGLTIYARTTTQYSIQLSHWRVFFLKSAFRLSGGHASGSFNRNQMDCNHFNTRFDVNADEKKCKIKYFCWFESKCVGQNSKKSSLIFMTKHNLWALSMTKLTAIKSGYFKPIGKLLLWFYSCRLFFFSETSLIKLWSCGYGCQSFYKRTSLFFFQYFRLSYVLFAKGQYRILESIQNYLRIKYFVIHHSIVTLIIFQRLYLVWKFEKENPK